MLTTKISYYSFCHQTSDIARIRFVTIPHSIHQSQFMLPKKNKIGQKIRKREIIPKNFDSIYSVVNARLKTSVNNHPIDSDLINPTINLSQSENVIFDNRDTKESFADFVCALKQRNTQFPDIWKQLNFHLNLLSARMPK